MTDTYKCPFCGHNKPYRETPYVDRHTGKKERQPCCDKQARNIEYQRKHFLPDDENKPDLTEIAKE